MRFYRGTHSYYCGIDLHARTMSLCLIDHQGTTLLEQNIGCDANAFLRAVGPYQHDRSQLAACFSDPVVHATIEADWHCATSMTR